ncbi:thrombospondin-1-like [Xenia sp. Carnegie-2017]|uniref:thrombospondin-1-like n=1 Tax=Xenia sp. Carnegie-2017 TaxID=2897299 RepID=UPI001F03BDF9|nr:thrombospondin-1-like [Xenia sp. Carnegie-2017]
MKSFFVPLLLFVIVFVVNIELSGGRKARPPKIYCYKVYRPQRNSCKSRIQGRFKTKNDCCQHNGGAGYYYGRGKGGRKHCTPCTSAENWSAWGDWTECDAKCGKGISRRIRRCLDINNAGCPGKQSEKKECTNPDRPHCPIHGGWSKWGNWSDCSKTCGKGRQLRFRSCTNPKPQHGGRDCKGVREDQQACRMTRFCPIDGGWGEWGKWSACSAKCDIGWRRRVRYCDKPKPQHGGKPCEPRDNIEKQSCDTYKKCDGSGSGSGDGSGASGDGSGASGDGSGASGDISGSGSGSGSNMTSIIQNKTSTSAPTREKTRNDFVFNDETPTTLNPATNKNT